MIQAGADAIVAFPISPTALNGVIKTACDKKVVFVAVNGVTEPCAYNIHIDQAEAGRATAEWLVNELNGRGNIVVITGVPGTSVDELRTAGAKTIFAKSAGIKIVAEIPGMWSEAVARQKLSQLLKPYGLVVGLHKSSRFR